MKIIGMCTGIIICLIGIAFTGFVFLIGISPGFGMSEGTRSEFFGGIALGAAITAVGVLLIWISRRKRNPQR